MMESCRSKKVVVVVKSSIFHFRWLSVVLKCSHWLPCVNGNHRCIFSSTINWSGMCVELLSFHNVQRLRLPMRLVFSLIRLNEKFINLLI
jgi:hypothetical protein